MRIRFSPAILGAALALLFGSVVMTAPSIAQSGDEAAVNQAVEALRKAMVDTDRAVLDKLTDAKLSYGHSAGKVETKAEFIDGVMGKKTIFKTITLTEPLVVVAGGNAIARHIFSADLETDGKPGAVKIGILQVWAKQDGGWKLFARQAFRL
jgi:ketosteroid isomerase-like protein